MKYSIAITPYLNNRPFLYHAPIKDCELVQLSPRESIRAMNNGEVHAGFVPVAGLKQVDEHFEMLGEFGIASECAVQSVLFLSQIPFSAFTPAHRVKLTHESITSVNLLGLLFGYQHGFDNLPMLANDYEEYDGELLIGDSALARLHNEQDMYVMDLSEQWNQYQKLPFVFARWVINKDAPNEFREELKQWLSTFVENEMVLKSMAAEQETQISSMTFLQAMDYLNRIKTSINEQGLISQELYLSELDKYNPEFHWSEKQLRKQYA